MNPPNTTFFPAPRRRRRQMASSSSASAPVALTLTAANLVFASSVVLRLVFDRDIDVSSINAGEITVQDPTGTGFEYFGDSVADQPAPNAVDLSLAENGASMAPIDSLTATADTGIVAANDGGTWAGVTELGLPYP